MQVHAEFIHPEHHSHLVADEKRSFGGVFFGKIIFYAFFIRQNIYYKTSYFTYIIST